MICIRTSLPLITLVSLSINASTIGLLSRGSPGQDAPEFIRGHIKNLGLVGGHSRCRERRRPLQHRHVSDEIALVRDGEFLFDVVPPRDVRTRESFRS